MAENTITTLGVVEYYRNLLIKQYSDKEKARATIATAASAAIMPQQSVYEITFRTAPASGTFVIAYGETTLTAIQWNDTAATVQTLLRALPGLGAVTVVGEISSLLMKITMVGVPAPSEAITLVSSTLNTDDPVILETDETLPLAVLNGFNILGTKTAVGAQLDIIGKYAGVLRSFQGLTARITLDDADFLTLIRFAVAVNTLGSSLYDIQSVLNLYFPDDITLVDDAMMHFTYLMTQNVGSRDLIEMLITQKKLPKPTGVGMVVIYAPVAINFFSMVTYESGGMQPDDTSPMNTYADYELDRPMLTYSYAV